MSGVRAMGFTVRGYAQVSMNLYALDATTPVMAFQAVVRLAHEAGVTIRASEIVGLVPKLAFRDIAEGADLKLPAPLESYIFERRLAEATAAS